MKKDSKKIKTKSVSQLKKELDAVFSKYIRLKYAKGGLVKCYTCDRVFHWKKIQNGHLVSRYYLATRFSENNCRPQCITCNIWRHGRIPEFAARLNREYGYDIVSELYQEATKLVFDFPYQEKIKYYVEEVIALSSLVSKEDDSSVLAARLGLSCPLTLVPEKRE